MIKTGENSMTTRQMMLALIATTLVTACSEKVDNRPKAKPVAPQAQNTAKTAEAVKPATPATEEVAQIANVPTEMEAETAETTAATTAEQNQNSAVITETKTEEAPASTKLPVVTKINPDTAKVEMIERPTSLPVVTKINPDTEKVEIVDETVSLPPTKLPVEEENKNESGLIAAAAEAISKVGATVNASVQEIIENTKKTESVKNANLAYNHLMVIEKELQAEVGIYFSQGVDALTDKENSYEYEMLDGHKGDLDYGVLQELVQDYIIQAEDVLGSHGEFLSVEQRSIVAAKVVAAKKLAMEFAAQDAAEDSKMEQMIREEAARNEKAAQAKANAEVIAKQRALIPGLFKELEEKEAVLLSASGLSFSQNLVKLLGQEKVYEYELVGAKVTDRNAAAALDAMIEFVATSEYALNVAALALTQDQKSIITAKMNLVTAVMDSVEKQAKRYDANSEKADAVRDLTTSVLLHDHALRAFIEKTEYSRRYSQKKQNRSAEIGKLKIYFAKIDGEVTKEEIIAALEAYKAEVVYLLETYKDPSLYVRMSHPEMVTLLVKIEREIQKESAR
jgi:hypothetical protein